MKSDGSFYQKWQVVLKKWRLVFLQPTGCFTCCELSCLKKKRGGDVIAVTLVTAKKWNPVERARVYARERHLLTVLFLTRFCQIRKKVLRLHPARPLKRANLVFCSRFVNCVFQNWGRFLRKLHFFVIYSLFGAISPHILIGRCFETW